MRLYIKDLECGSTCTKDKFKKNIPFSVNMFSIKFNKLCFDVTVYNRCYNEFRKTNKFIKSPYGNIVKLGIENIDFIEE